MVLGEGLIDAEGVRHEMLGALPLVTSFAAPKRHLGYRRLTPTPGFFWDMELSAHEFHYASVVSEGEATNGSLRRVMRWAPTLGMQDCAAAMWRDPSCM
jgi:cobyrinic acid a,c-diamide synthase